jgi:hypothetical protein
MIQSIDQAVVEAFDKNIYFEMQDGSKAYVDKILQEIKEGKSAKSRETEIVKWMKRRLEEEQRMSQMLDKPLNPPTLSKEDALIIAKILEGKYDNCTKAKNSMRKMITRYSKKEVEENVLDLTLLEKQIIKEDRKIYGN